MALETLAERKAENKMFSTYAMWRDTLANLTISSIVWDNLPDTVDPIYLERQLFYKGPVLFFATDQGLVCMSGFGSSLPNIYNIPTEREAHASNGFHAHLTNENSVICYNDIMRRPGVTKANIYAGRLANIDNIIDVNCQAQCTPVLLTASDETILSVKNAYVQMIEGVPAIAVKDDFDPNSISSINTQAPFTAPQLRQLQHDLFAEYCTSVGIANSNNYKAERLITSEVYSNNAGVLIQQQAKLRPRQQVCDFLNNSEFFKPYLTKGPISVRFEVDAVDEVMAVDPENNDLNTMGGED